MENSRTESARRHDDSAIIDNAEAAPDHQDRSGGNLQTDVATQVAEARVDDPEASRGVSKTDAIDHATNVRRDRPRAADGG